MARVNVKEELKVVTHEGASAVRINSEQQLRRTVLSCLLWEDSFYEDGVSIADRIKKLVKINKPEIVANVAIEARTKMKLRHVPLLLVRELARHPKRNEIKVSKILSEVIQRADELAEFLAIYWKEKREPLSKQVKLGLAKAFTKFSEYDLAKYNRDDAIKLRDVLFLCHAKPKDDNQAEVWKKLVDKELESPDTWEVNLSSGANKKDTFERLIDEKKLGPLALLRNLRNMYKSDVDKQKIISALENMNVERILPYRFITAAKYAPHLESYLEKSMIKCLSIQEKIKGRTILLVDVSGSMDSGMSSKTEITKIDAACALAILLREICEDVEVYTFSEYLKLVPARSGFALRDSIIQSQPHSGTKLGSAVENINYKEKGDRLIVFTDEQSSDDLPNCKIGKGYIVNVASYLNGIGYKQWLHIDGFSEAVIDFIREYEKN